MKYVAVSGATMSGIGKGIIASSTGLLLKTMGFKVSAIKIDPYMNIDAGTMSPLEHGEVFVLDDGGEADLDLGNYERYLNVTLTRENNITTGKVYMEVIQKERAGAYLGKTVQIVPHLTNAIQDWIQRVARIPVDDTDEEPDICIIELGGTVGDIESAPFVEALRQFQFRVGHDNFCLVHVSMIPVINGEQKTKPTQAAMRDLRGLGLTADLIACRCSVPLDPSAVEKISMFCHVDSEHVFGVHDLSSVYHVPVLLDQQLLAKVLSKRLNLSLQCISQRQIEKGARLWTKWKQLTQVHDHMYGKVTIALVGKYTNLKDAYISVIKSLEHASLRCQHKLDLQWVDAGDLEHEMSQEDPVKFHKAWHVVCSANGILVPGGFGTRGTEGMIRAANWAREKKVPFLGICLGMQVAVIEFARNMCNLKHANSTEFAEETQEPVVIFMPEGSKTHMGATMRLGLRVTKFQAGSESTVIRKLYHGKDEIHERHRHRYEVNPEYIRMLEEKGLRFVGKDDAGVRMEIMQVDDHPYYVGTQYHPEYLSRVIYPSPPFVGFIAASAGVLEQHLETSHLTNGVKKADLVA